MTAIPPAFASSVLFSVALNEPLLLSGKARVRNTGKACSPDLFRIKVFSICQEAVLGASATFILAKNLLPEIKIIKAAKTIKTARPFFQRRPVCFENLMVGGGSLKN